MLDCSNPIIWKAPNRRYMSGKGQDQNVQITCCSTYSKQLLHNLFNNLCPTTRSFLQITCCLTYSKQLLHILFNSLHSTTRSFLCRLLVQHITNNCCTISV